MSNNTIHWKITTVWEQGLIKLATLTYYEYIKLVFFFFKVYDFTSDDLQDLGEIGRGGFGTVNKMLHRSSDTVMAVKVVKLI